VQKKKIQATILLETNVWAKTLDLNGITMMGIKRSDFVFSWSH